MTPKFQDGGTVRKNRFYLRRDADDILYKEILNDEFCYVLSSRQIGKSSLMVRVAQKLKMDGIKVAMIDLTGIGTGNISAKAFYNSIFYNISKDLKLDFQPSILDFENYTLDKNFEIYIRDVRWVIFFKWS